MSKVKFIVEAGRIGVDGVVMIVDGIKIPETLIPLHIDFNIASLVSECNVFKENGKIMAEAEISENFKNLFPAAAFKYTEVELPEPGKTIVRKADLVSFSLCHQPNADFSIKMLSEQ